MPPAMIIFRFKRLSPRQKKARESFLSAGNGGVSGTTKEVFGLTSET